MFYRLLVLLPSLLLLVACQTPAPGRQPEADPQILGVFIRLYQQDGEWSLELLDVMRGPGRLKSWAPVSARPGELHCTLLDARRRPLQHFAASNPLVEDQEVAEEDGNLRRVRIEKKSEVLTLRIPWQERFHFLRLEYLESEGKMIRVGEVELGEGK